MSESLKIFGKTYTGVAGFKAKNTSNTPLVYVLSGSESGGGDVTLNVDANGYAIIPSTGNGSSGGMTTIASGTFVGNNNGDSDAGVGRQLFSIGTKMAQTDFWISVSVDDGEEFEYSSDRQVVYLFAVAKHEFGSYDLSTTGSKDFTSSYSVDSNNSGTITTRAAGMVVRNGKQMYNGSLAEMNTFNYCKINRESDHFDLWMGISNSVYKFPAKTYNWEIVYFGSDPSNDIIEIT